MRTGLIFFCIIFLLPGCSSILNRDNEKFPPHGIARDIQELTGSRTRIVWVQDHSEKSNDVLANGNKLLLMGFDTMDDKGAHPILPDLSNYYTPLITPTGDRIVYTNRSQRKIYVVDWDGNAPKELSEGIALDVWQEAQTKEEWVYAYLGDGRKSSAIFRFRIDKPNERELLWDGTNQGPFNEPHFRLSGDGKYASAKFPRHPDCGILSFQNKSWRKFGNGCWPYISPDYSYMLWIFDGPHRNIYLYPHTQYSPNMRKVNINDAPGIDGYEVYHPRWSNHVRIMTMTGPYKVGEGGNKIFGGGNEVEVYIGRFDEGFTAIEKWVKVTDDTFGNFFPNVWVENVTHEPISEKHAGLIRSKSVSAELDKKGLIFFWENAIATNAVMIGKGERICRVQERGYAKYGRFHDMDLASGYIEAIGSDELLLDSCKETNELTIEAIITPDNLQQGGPARIITFSSGHHTRNFTLGQEGNMLVFRLRTSVSDENGIKNQRNLCWIKAGEPHHVIITYKSGNLICYLNGIPIEPEIAVEGDFSNWTEQQLLFGDEAGGGRDWKGHLEKIAIFNRVVDPKEAEKRYGFYAEQLRKRQSVERIEIEARLIEKSVTPSDISPYRRCLAEYTYEVINVLKGKCDYKRILVNHWVILDDKVLPNTRQIGDAYLMTLEPFDAHPQLNSERRSIDTEDFTLPSYYDLTRLQ